MSIGSKLKEKLSSGSFQKAKTLVKLTVGDSVRLAREFNNLGQNNLAELTSIPQSTISGIERNKINLGVERAKVLARSLNVHPAVLLFPNWDTEKEAAA